MARANQCVLSTATPRKRDSFQRVRHARYFEDDVVYHVVFRTTQGLHLLHPDRGGRLRGIAAGILARARNTFPGVKNHATVLLSNHGHLAISGDLQQLAAYVGFLKRELSRRWGPIVRWRSLFEAGYHATALITANAQRRCLKYILSQSVKEGLVGHPTKWPGLHCADSLMTGRPIKGEWFNGTNYGTDFHRAKRRGQQEQVRRDDYSETCEAWFDPLPCMAHLSEEQCQREMIVWDDSRDPEVQGYKTRYWNFQDGFRTAAKRWATGDLAVASPPGSFRPGLSRPVAHLHISP